MDGRKDGRTTWKQYTPTNIVCRGYNNHRKVFLTELLSNLVCWEKQKRELNRKTSPRPGNFQSEPPHEKTNKIICVLSEDADQPWWMPRLIWDFAGHTGHFVWVFLCGGSSNESGLSLKLSMSSFLVFSGNQKEVLFHNLILYMFYTFQLLSQLKTECHQPD